MKNTSELEKLSVPDLIIFNKNLELGEEHLKKILTQYEFQTLLSFSSLGKLHEKIDLDPPEKVGKFVLSINPVITGIFGAWMGFAGFTNIGIGHPAVLLTLLCLAFILATTLGAISIITTKRGAEAKNNEIKTLKIQSHILEIIKAKKNQEIAEKFKFIKEKTHELSKGKATNLGEDKLTKEKINELLENFNHEIENSLPHISHSHKDLIVNKIKKPAPCKVREPSPDISPVIAKLCIEKPKESPKAHSWIRANLSLILISAIPTLFGTFGSMFVYLGGAHDISRALNNETIFSFLSNPKVKAAELVIAPLVTLYFLVSFLYVNKKSYERDKQVDIYRKEITEKESVSTELDEILKIARDGQRYVEEVLNILKALRSA